MKDFEQLSEPKEIRTVKEMDPDDQPRERALKFGISSLSTPDLWALILRTGMKGKPITELCRDIMRSCNSSLFELERLPLEMIMNIPGIGTTKALQIESVMELIRRYSTEKSRKKTKIMTPDDIFGYMRHKIGNLPYEQIWILFLNRANEVTGEKMITSGSAVASVFDLKKIIKEALLRDADAIVMVHNHPSGNLSPSIQDDNITASLQKACKMMELRMLDHVIVTTDGYYSYQNSGKL